VIETLSNIRTVASLTLEETCATEYEVALRTKEPHPLRASMMSGAMEGLGGSIRMWSLALLFWWGGWLLHQNPYTYTFREFLIALFALFFSLYGLAIASQGLSDREQATLAVERIFELMDRQSRIDPLSESGFFQI